MGTYPSFEVSAGDVVAQVESNSRYLTNGGTFDTTTWPTLTKVELFAGNAYYYVVGQLYSHGYGTIPANTAVQNILTQIQALDTTVQVEQSVPTDEKGDPNTRHKGFITRRDQMIGTFLGGRALDTLGQASASDMDKSSFLELTGRSISRSDTVQADSDIWQPRFPRGYQNKKAGSSGEADE